MPTSVGIGNFRRFGEVLTVFRIAFIVAGLVGVIRSDANAAEPIEESLRELASPDSDVVERRLNELAASGNTALIPALEALCDARLRVAPDGAVYYTAPKERTLRHPLTGTIVDPQPSGTHEVEVNTQIRSQALPVLEEIECRQHFLDAVGALFHGISLASILLLAALGLAVTFDLLGVINMAHGEILML